MPSSPRSVGGWVIPTVALFVGAFPVAAQEGSVGAYELPATEIHRLPSTLVGDTFVVAVALPSGSDARARGLPLVVMTDADLAFGATTQIARLMQYRSEIPDVVLVGVGYGDVPTALRVRRRDLTPSDPPGLDECREEPGCGGAGRFLRFVQEELLPFVEARYGTSGDRTYVGASLGGLFGAYALFRGSGTFRRYVLGSPTVSWDGQRLIRRGASGSTVAESPPSAVFIGVGGAEGTTVDDARELERAVISAWPEGPSVRFDVFEGERHMSVQPMVVARGLRWVFQEAPPSLGGGP